MLNSSFGFHPTSRNQKTLFGCFSTTTTKECGKQKVTILRMNKKRQHLPAKFLLMNLRTIWSPISYFQSLSQGKKILIRLSWELLTLETHVIWIRVFKCFFTFVLWEKSFLSQNPTKSCSRNSEKSSLCWWKNNKINQSTQRAFFKHTKSTINCQGDSKMYKNFFWTLSMRSSLSVKKWKRCGKESALRPHSQLSKARIITQFSRNHLPSWTFIFLTQKSIHLKGSRIHCKISWGRRKLKTWLTTMSTEK